MIGSMLRYSVSFDMIGDPVAVFSSPSDANLWAEEQHERFMDLPLSEREIKKIIVRDEATLKIEREFDVQNDAVFNTIAAIKVGGNRNHLQFRVLTDNERMIIRDALEERAQRHEQGSLEVLRSMIAMSGDDNDATLKVTDLRHVMIDKATAAKRSRLLGEFIRRNHVVVHCHITIPEL